MGAKGACMCLVYNSSATACPAFSYECDCAPLCVWPCRKNKRISKGEEGWQEEVVSTTPPPPSPFPPSPPPPRLVHPLHWIAAPRAQLRTCADAALGRRGSATRGLVTVGDVALRWTCRCEKGARGELARRGVLMTWLSRCICRRDKGAGREVPEAGRWSWVAAVLLLLAGPAGGLPKESMLGAVGRKTLATVERWEWGAYGHSRHGSRAEEAAHWAEGGAG